MQLEEFQVVFLLQRRGCEMKLDLKKQRRVLLDTGSMVKIGMLSGVGVVLMLLDFPLPIFPAFLKMDISDVPSIIGTFAMGTWAGVAIEFLKNLLKIIIGSNTFGVGELANFLVGIAYVIPLGIIYQKQVNRKGVLVGCLTAVISMAIFGGIFNYFILIPFYARAFDIPVDSIVNTAAKINSLIIDFRTLIVYAIVPFNLLKGIIMSVVGFGLFKVLQPLFKKN